MNARSELVERVASRRRAELGSLSDAGYQELLEAVRGDVEHFIDSPEEEAFLLVTKAVERESAARDGEDLLDDNAFFEARTRRMACLSRDCDEALAIDPTCLDARLLHVLAQDQDPDATLGPLLELEQTAIAQLGGSPMPADAWTDVRLRPLLRIKAAVSRSSFDSARYRLASEKGEEAIALSPSDALGLRHTCALAYARLEDETAFDALDVRFSRQGSAWSHLGRAILLYKLGRMPAARRAISGYTRLVEGGAYALIKPILIDTYLPDRPEAAPLSFQEATLAVHEADPVICDVPDFVGWAQGIRDVWFSAQDFANRKGFDW